MTYSEYQKAVYDYLLEKRKTTPGFNFSVRQKASRSAERNYFIGSEKRKYFGFTFWTIPVAFPGASTDLVNFIFEQKDGFRLKFQVSISKLVTGLQNELDLQFSKQLLEKLKEAGLPVRTRSAESNMLYYEIRPTKSFTVLDDALDAFFNLWSEVVGIVDEEIANVKREHPDWNAGRITDERFDDFQQKMSERFTKYPTSPDEEEVLLNDDGDLDISPGPTEIGMTQLEVDSPINQILYGPPGTGKTYMTITEAAHVLTGEFYTDRYAVAKALYKTALGDQIEFITFHQNYSYEDFVAGLRPDTSVTDTLAFREHKGIFYEICERARKNLKLWQEHATYIEPEFQDVFDAFLQPLREDENAEIRLETEAEKVPFYITRINKNNLSFRKNSGGTGHKLSFNALQEMFEGRRPYSQKSINTYLRPVVNRLHAMAESMRSKTAPISLKNYVLIIDEINRANISRVFGELITLLEEDKRLGNKHEMEISLPNGERFSVPKNLYLIGTMNTADKSIALLDIALRRRFQFKPMFPKEELVRDPAQQQFLRSLNSMILKERGADFLVGHAYLMAHENEEKRFDEVMNNQIIPLLKEYFYNDGADKVFNLLQSSAQVPGFQFVKDAYLGVTCNARL